jgi:hypothetical protein
MTFVRSLLIIAGLCTDGGPRSAAELLLKVLPFPVSASAEGVFNAFARRVFDSMKARRGKQTSANLFDVVRTVGLGLPGVEAVTKYDGSR